MRILLLLLLAGCASTAKEIHLPDGSLGQSIDCSGTARTWGNCYERAGRICGTRGYEVVAGGSEQGALVSANQQMMIGGSTMFRTMVIKCK